MLVVRAIARLELGGAQLGALRLMKGLRDCGIQSRVVAGSADAECVALYRQAGFEVDVWGANLSVQYECNLDFASWMRPALEGADLVHGHMFGAWWALAAAAEDGVPVVASEHNALQWPGRPRLAEMRRALQRIDAFFAHGPAARETVLRLGLPESRVHRGLSAIEMSPAGVESSDGRLFGEALGPRVLFAGRLHPEKGADILVRAIGSLADPPACFILGAGPQDAYLRQLSDSLGLGQKVRFMGWQDRIAPWLAGADLVVVPSRHDAWSQSAVSAMAHGVPVVATAVEGLPEVLADGRGVLVAPDDPAALARGIDDVLRGHRVVDLEAARRYARRHSVGEIARSYERIYRGLVPRSRPAAARPATAA